MSFHHSFVLTLFQEEKGQFFYDMKAGPEQRGRKRDGQQGRGRANDHQGKNREYNEKRPRKEGRSRRSFFHNY